MTVLTAVHIGRKFGSRGRFLVSLGDEEMEERVSTIWVKCPATGRRASTGIVTDQLAFDALPSRLTDAPCPACGLKHLWRKEDAWLVDPQAEWAIIKKAATAA